MGKYHVHRSDTNATEILDWLEAHMASVSRSGRPTDAIVGYRGLSALVEIKTPKGKLRPSQKEFLMTWRGAVAVLRTTQDAEELLVWMEACARYIPAALANHGSFMATRDIR